MKTNKNYIFLSILIFVIVSTSCVQDGGFSVPNVIVTEPDITPNATVLAVKTALQQEFNANGDLVYTFFDNPENPTIIEGYVVSSDATGNFYKKLIIQDKPANPTAGIEVALNKTSISETFDIGRKVYIKLDGLSVSYDDGESTIDPNNLIPGKYILGVLDGDRVSAIPSTAVKDHIFRSATVEEIIPTDIKLADINETHINTMVLLSSTQMLKSNLTKTFAGEPFDEFDGFRTIFECNSENKIQLQTSTFASFKSNLVPQGKGAITVVLSKDFRAEFLVAIINTPSNINFTDTERCDPVVLECTGTSGGETTIYSENFEDFNSYASKGWFQKNISGTNTKWFLDTFRGNDYSRIETLGSGDEIANVWLITPKIDLSTTTQEELYFNIQANYDTGTNLSVHISTDYAGDPETATWQRLDAQIPSGPRGGFGSFKTVGPINISCVDGTDVSIGFLYKGSDPTASTRYHLDNIKIKGN